MQPLLGTIVSGPVNVCTALSCVLVLSALAALAICISNHPHTALGGCMLCAALHCGWSSCLQLHSAILLPPSAVGGSMVPAIKKKFNQHKNQISYPPACVKFRTCPRRNQLNLRTQPQAAHNPSLNSQGRATSHKVMSGKQSHAA